MEGAAPYPVVLTSRTFCMQGGVSDMLTARGPPRLGQGSGVSESGLHTGRATESGVGQPLRGARTQGRLGLDLFDTTGGNGCHSY